MHTDDTGACRQAQRHLTRDTPGTISVLGCRDFTRSDSTPHAGHAGPGVLPGHTNPAWVTGW